MGNLLNEIITLFKTYLFHFATGKGKIPVSYYCGQYTTGYYIGEDDYESEEFEESCHTEYYADDYKDLVKFLTRENGDAHHDFFGMHHNLKEVKLEFIDYVIHKTCEKLQKYGLRYESIEWFLRNYKSLNNLEEISVRTWGKYGFEVRNYYNLKELREKFWEYCKGILSDIQYYSDCKNKYDRLVDYKNSRMLNNLIQEYYSLGGESKVKIVDYTNHLDEVVGWTEYDLNNKIVSGYKVTCWSSSWLGLGNCRCVSHEPGYNFEYPLTIRDVKRLIKMQEEKKKYLEDLKTLPEGTFIISEFENWSGKYIEDKLVINKEGAFREWVTCKNSWIYGGTCRCQSHNPTSIKLISIEEAKKLLVRISDEEVQK